MSSLFYRLAHALKSVETLLISRLMGKPPFSPEFALGHVSEFNPIQRTQISLKDIIGHGFLWATPKTRRSLEKRLNRKFGWPRYVWKPLVPRTNLIICNSCGQHHEPRVICPTCYTKVMHETNSMKEAIQKELGLSPVEEEVVVLYEGEKSQHPPEFWQGKRVVEMDKPKPAWFSKNLLQRSTQEPSTSTDVKPTELA